MACVDDTDFITIQRSSCNSVVMCVYLTESLWFRINLYQGLLYNSFYSLNVSKIHPCRVWYRLKYIQNRYHFKCVPLSVCILQHTNIHCLPTRNLSAILLDVKWSYSNMNNVSRSLNVLMIHCNSVNISYDSEFNSKQLLHFFCTIQREHSPF